MTALPRTKPGNGTNDKSLSITSAGEVFDDGALIELVSGSSTSTNPDLLLWNNNKVTIGSSVKKDGRIYRAPKLRQDFYRAIRLPASSSGYASARKLFEALDAEFKHRLDLGERESSLLACFAISSWIGDCLPIMPSLCISGPDQQTGVGTLRLLSCFCRHSLMLADVTPAVLRSLPTQLSLTLLIHQEELKPNMKRFFRLSSYRGVYCVGRGGKVVDLSGPKAIFCANGTDLGALGEAVIHVSVAPSSSRLSAPKEQALRELAKEFQPRLLAYRLKNYPKIEEVKGDFPELTTATRQLARAVAACFPEDPDLACQVVQLLKPQDEETRGRCFYDVNYAIVEVLLGLIHSRKQREERVDELAKNVNALLWSRGETLSYSAEEVGWKLRGLNIPRHSSTSGRQVLLTRETKLVVHRLAQSYGVPRAEKDCRDCAESEANVDKGLMQVIEVVKE